MCLLLAAMPLCAQRWQTWEEAWQAFVSAEDIDDETRAEDDYELLSQLADHPLELNRATREELEQLPFLSEQQVMDMLEYCHRYGPMRSLGELRMIRSLDLFQLDLLPFFVYIDDRTENVAERTSFRPHSQLTLTGRQPFYDRHGDRKGYLGYKYRHSLRYELTLGNKLKAGLVGAQDAGEPFFSNNNKWGYDAWSYYVQLDKTGPVERAVIGKYKVSAGLGLVLNTSFSLGKLAMLQTLGRQSNTLRPHSSRTESDYFQGAAATLALGRKHGIRPSPLKLTAFVSYRPVDGTLNADGILTNLTYNNYHRTPSEMARKHNTHLTAFGGRMAYRSGGWHAALNGVTTHIDRELCPPSTVLYRRYDARGTRFTNTSLDYGYMHYRLTVAGETAIDRDGDVAAIHTVGCQFTDNLAMMALWRFYSYRYNGLYSHSFGNHTDVQNENGGFVGVKWNALPNLHLQAYADYAYSPWARYLVSLPSHAWDFLLQADYQWQRWNLQARGRVHLRQRDDETKAALTDNNDYRARLALTYSPTEEWSGKMQVDATQHVYLQRYNGWMVSGQGIWQKPDWQLCATAAFFDTDDYASRVYYYERTLSHEIGTSSYYGQGLRLAFLARVNVGRSIRLTARLGYTNYFDRSVIGTGLQQIDHSHQTDLDLQLRWRF